MANRSFRLQGDLDEKLNAEAALQQRSANWIVNHALKRYLEDKEEERVRWQETLEAMAEIDRGEGIPAEKVFEWLDSWGSDKPLPPPQ